MLHFLSFYIYFITYLLTNLDLFHVYECFAFNVSVYQVCAWFLWRLEVVYETELGKVVSCYVDAVNRTWVLYENKCSPKLSHLSRPIVFIFESLSLVL